MFTFDAIVFCFRYVYIKWIIFRFEFLIFFCLALPAPNYTLLIFYVSFTMWRLDFFGFRSQRLFLDFRNLPLYICVSLKKKSLIGTVAEQDGWASHFQFLFWTLLLFIPSVTRICLHNICQWLMLFKMELKQRPEMKAKILVLVVFSFEYLSIVFYGICAINASLLKIRKKSLL